MDTVSLRAPPSKSVTHRAMLLAALSSRACVVERPLLGADCLATLAALRSLGADVTVEPDGLRFRPIEELRPPPAPLDCANAGTALRLLTAQCARLDAPIQLSGDASLRARPNGPLLDALTHLGAQVQAGDRGRAPITVHGPLRPGVVELGPGVSSQYGTALLLSLPLLAGDSELTLHPPIASKPYLTLTLQLAAGFGLQLRLRPTSDGGLHVAIPGGQRPRRSRVRVEGDWSSAAFPLVAAALHRRSVRVEGLRRRSTQGDRAIVSLLQRFDQKLVWEGGALRLEPRPCVAAGEVDLGPTPDLFPALCALAAAAPGRTVLAGAPSLRDKECDRIEAMASGLRALGVQVCERPDGLVIDGGRIGSGQVDARADHRIHMAFSLLDGVDGADVVASDAGCEAVSYPGFRHDLRRLRGG